MFCTNCGNKLPENASFCPFCGTKAHIPGAPAAEEPIEELVEAAAEPIVETAEEAAEPVVETVEEVAEPIVEAVEVAEPVAEAVETVAEPIVEAVEEPIAEVVEAAEPIVGSAEESVIEAVEPIVETAEPVVETVDAVEAIAEPVIEAVEEPIVEATGPVIAEPVAEEIEAAAEPVVESVEAAAEPVAEAVEAAAETVEAVEAPVEEAVEAAAEPVSEATAEMAAAAVAGADTPTADVPGEPPKKKKKGLIAAIIAVVIIALGVAGYFIYQNLPSTKLAKLRTQIAASIEAGEYRTAISQIEQAYEYAPDDEELRSQYVACNLPLLTDRFAANDYEGFIADADKLIKDYPQAAETLDPLIKDSYEALADGAIDTHDIPTMQAIKDRLTDLTSSGRFNFSEKITWIEDNIQHVEMTNLFQTLADKLLPLIKSGDRAAVFDTIRSEFISSTGSARKLAPNRATVEYHFPLYSKADENGKRLGIYYSNSHYCFYYGNYNGTRREGDAIWFCADNLRTDSAYREYWTEGPWSNDKPNGTFTLSNLSKYATAETEQLVEGTVDVKDGLYNGKGVFTYDGSVPMSGSYKNGIADVIMTTDPNGNESNVILISEDEKVWVSRTNINDPIGIYGFY